MNQDKIELKPCPFCGDENPGVEGQMHTELGFVYFHVYCTACGASGLWHLIKERAISAWNKRAATKQESDCDTCATKSCKSRSASVVRINCPLWRHG